MTKTISSISEALAFMRRESRSLISPEVGNEILAAFDLPADLVGKPTRDFYGASFPDDTADLPSVSVPAIAVWIAHEVVPGFVSPQGPYRGRGSNAEFRTMESCNAIEAHLQDRAEMAEQNRDRF